MQRALVAAAVLGAVFPLACAPPALAHGIAGKRIFPTTLVIDDPAVADEASLPTVSWQRNGATDDGPATRTANVAFELAKRITPDLGIAVGGGWTRIDTVGQDRSYGWQNLELTLKYQAFRSDAHEALVSVGVSREWGGTGAGRVGAEATGSTTPTLYFGKGFGDLPDGVKWLKPLAVTGIIGYQFQDVPTGTVTTVDPDSGVAALAVQHKPDLLLFGASVQYSIPYLQQNVRDLGLPDFLGRLTPLVEISYSAPATRSNGVRTQGLVAPGFVYAGDSWQFGVEAVVPTTKGGGTNVGVIAQLHFFLDDLFPTTLGKPLFGN